MKPEGRSVFCYYYNTQCQKQWVILWSPSHQHNAHTVPTTVTESLGFGTEPRLPKESLSRTFGRPDLDYIEDNPVSTCKDSVFIYISFTTPQEGWKEKKKIQEKTWDDSQLAMVCHLNLWNDASRTQKCDQMRFTYERRIGRSRQLFSSVSWRPKVQKNNLFSQIYKSASVRNSWDCCCVATSWRKVQTLMTKM